LDKIDLLSILADKNTIYLDTIAKAPGNIEIYCLIKLAKKLLLKDFNKN